MRLEPRQDELIAVRNNGILHVGLGAANEVHQPLVVVKAAIGKQLGIDVE